jgi:hypothetical protein
MSLISSCTPARTFALSLCFLVCAAAWGGREFPQQPGEKAAADELLVRLAPGARLEDLTALLPALANVTRIHGSSQHFRLHLPPGLAKQLSAKLAGSALVDYVEPNRIRDHTALPPNDAFYGLE